MTTGRLDLVVNKGSTFRRVFTWTTKDSGTGQTAAVDLTDFTARSMFREDLESPAFFDLSTENGGIELGGEDGTITMEIPADVSSAVVAERGVWDLELYGVQGYVIRLLEGKVKLTPEVTR